MVLHALVAPHMMALHDVSAPVASSPPGWSCPGGHARAHVIQNVGVCSANRVIAHRVAARRAVAGVVRRPSRTRDARVALHVLVCVTQHFIARCVGTVLATARRGRCDRSDTHALVALHVVVGTAHDGVALRVRSGRVVPGLIFLPGSARTHA